MKKLTTLFGTAAMAALLLTGGVKVGAAEAISKQDKEFIKSAAELGTAEVELGRLGEQKAADPALKSIGARMVADHTKANAELMALARSKGVEVKAEPSGGEKRALDAIAAKSGTEFDKDFRDRLMKDHDKAIRTFQTAARECQDPDVRAWAQKMLPALEHHREIVAGNAAPGHHPTTRATEERRTPERRESRQEGQVKTQ